MHNATANMLAWANGRPVNPMTDTTFDDDDYADADDVPGMDDMIEREMARKKGRD